MAILESKFNVGDKVFRGPNLLSWASGRTKGAELYEIKSVEISEEATSNGEPWRVVRYRTTNGAYFEEKEAVAEKDAKALAIYHLTDRLNVVASANYPADPQP